MMIDHWIEYFGLEKSVGSFVFLTSLFVLFTTVAYSLFIIVALFLNAKLASRTEARIGVRVGGMFGLFFPVANLIRSSAKRDITPSLWVHINFALQMATVSGIVFTLPLNPYFYPIQSDYGILVPLLLTLMFFTMRIALMFSASAVEVRLSAVRTVAMVTACLAPLTFLVFFLGQELGGYSFQSIINSKQALGHWTILRGPLVFLAAFGFVFCSLPMISGLRNETLYFDPLFSKTDVQIYNRLIIEIFEFTWWIYTAVLFFGGWSIPFVGLGTSFHGDIPIGIGLVLGTAVLMFKGLTFYLLGSWVRRWVPVARMDQLTDRIWKVGLPLSLILMIGGLLWKQIQQ